jgi:hypothetical protein
VGQRERDDKTSPPLFENSRLNSMDDDFLLSLSLIPIISSTYPFPFFLPFPFTARFNLEQLKT